MGAFGHGGMGRGMGSADRPSRGAGGVRQAVAADLTQARPKPKFKEIWPEIRALILPRRWLLAGCFCLMVVNRACSLVLPAASKPFIDLVFNRHRMDLLPWIVGAVVTATIAQGVTSYALTQLLSKSGQRLITELRMQVQQHVGRLSVAFYDENRTGTLVARIMNDVEGVRNFIGTGVVDFIGGVLTALFAFLYLLHQAVGMTLVVFVIMALFTLVLQKAFKVIRPIFRERAKINAEVTGRLTESLGGVRVVKGYHAEESEARVFTGGVQRLLDNVISSLTAQSLMSLASTVILGVVGALVMFLGAHAHAAGKLTTGGYFAYVLFLGFMTIPIVQLVNIGTQLTEAMAGLDRTREIMGEREEDSEPQRATTLGSIVGDVRFVDVGFAYVPDKPVLHQLRVEARHGDRAGRLERLGQVDNH
jgi:ABC-type bacteriocin/lantibiotic exporter with double-glycine peptidase domain